MICLALMLATTGCGSGVMDVSAFDPATATRTYPVTKFGAKGDGIADDAPAIQKAMTAAANAGGGQVTFPCGEFSLRSVAGAAPGGRSLLYLKGSMGVQLVGQGACSHLYTVLPQKSVFEFDGSAQPSVTSLKITALNAPYIETYGMDGGSAVRFTGVSHGSISHVEVDGASAGALYVTAGTSNSSIANNFVHDTDGSGIWEDDCGSANAHNCEPSLAPQNNIYESNTLTNAGQMMLAALSTDDGGKTAHAIIRNNTISWTKPPLASNTQVHCIQIGNTVDVSVLNNTCTGTPYDGIVVTTANKNKSSKITIQGNTITSSGGPTMGGSGIVIFDDPNGGGISEVSITYNNISMAQTDGIRLYSASRPGGILYVQIENNSIDMVDQHIPGSRYGIDVEFSALVTVSSNKITCNGKCIAAGVNVNTSIATTPTAASNSVTNIVGPPLIIH